MYALFRSLYRSVDRLMLAWLPTSWQRWLKGRILSTAKRLYPARILARSPGELIASDLMRSRNGPLPGWARDEVEALAGFEPEVLPLTRGGAALTRYEVPYDIEMAGRVYAELRRSVDIRPDAVVLVPWLKTGGADLGALHVVRALVQEFGLAVLVVATEPADSPWAERLPPGTRFVEMGKRLGELTHEEQVAVLMRLLLQLAPRFVHVMNSRLGWDCVRRHGLALRQQSRLFASLYCDDYDAHGNPVGYAREYLRDCHAHLQGVLSDNTCTWRSWVTALGVPPSLFSTVPFPLAGAIAPPVEARCDGVLWAGRIDRQKRPDLLAEIARLLPDVPFHVHGHAVIDRDATYVSRLARLPNVTLHGTYGDFASIAKNCRSVFLYTSAWDGMPNVLLEAAAAGLPIVAPRLGGIGDFLPERAMVPADGEAAAYAERIQSLMAEPQLANLLVDELQEKLRTERSWNRFVHSLRDVPGYVTSTAGSAARDNSDASALACVDARESR